MRVGCSNFLKEPVGLNDCTFPSIEELLAILDQCGDAVVITEPQSPFRVHYVNKAWEELCEYSKSDIIGQSLSCIEGPNSLSYDGELLRRERLNRRAMRRDVCKTSRSNHKKSGKMFLDFLQVMHSNDINLHWYKGDPFLLAYLPCRQQH